MAITQKGGSLGLRGKLVTNFTSFGLPASYQYFLTQPDPYLQQVLHEGFGIQPQYDGIPPADYIAYTINQVTDPAKTFLNGYNVLRLWPKIGTVIDNRPQYYFWFDGLLLLRHPSNLSFLGTDVDILIDYNSSSTYYDFVLQTNVARPFSITASRDGVSFVPQTSAGSFTKSSYTSTNALVANASVNLGEPKYVVLPEESLGSIFYWPGAHTPGVQYGRIFPSADFNISKVLFGIAKFGSAGLTSDFSLTKNVTGIRLRASSSLTSYADLNAVFGFRVRGAMTNSASFTTFLTTRVNPGGYAPNITADFSLTATAGVIIRPQWGRYVDEDYQQAGYFTPEVDPPTAAVDLKKAQGNVRYSNNQALLETNIDLVCDVNPIRSATAYLTWDSTVAVLPQLTLDSVSNLTSDAQVDTIAANLIDFGTQGYVDPNYTDPNYFEGFNLRINLSSEFSLDSQAANEVIVACDFSSDSTMTTEAGYRRDSPLSILESTTRFDTLGGNGPGIILRGFTVACDALVTATTQARNIIKAQADLLAFNDIRIISGRIQQASATVSVETEQTATPTYTAGILLDLTSDFILTPLVGYGLYAQAHFYANAFELATGKITALDDYYIVVVAPETRIINPGPEPRYLLVKPETRITTTLNENRDFLVEPEMRTYKITANLAQQIGRRTRRLEQ